MQFEPQDFFNLYVLAPHAAWCEDELCEWKALATASGINALVEHVLKAANPTDPIDAPAYKRKLGDYRRKWGARSSIDTFSMSSKLTNTSN